MWFEIEAASFRQEFGSLLGDDIKFKKIDEMKQIRVNPLLFDPVAKTAHELYMQLAAELLSQDIQARLATSPAAFYELEGKSQRVRLSAMGCVLEDEPAVSLRPPVTVEEYAKQGDKPPRKFLSEKAILYLDDTTPDLQVHLQLSSAEVIGTGQSVIHHAAGGLAMPESIRQALRRTQAGGLRLGGDLSSVLQGPPSPKLAGLQAILERQIRGTLVDITGEIHSRLVFGVGCIPMILIGIGLGILKRGGHLLSAFGASCVPGAVLIVAIISGRQVAGNTRWAEATPGILIMWAGLAFLLLLAAIIYSRLLRH